MADEDLRVRTDRAIPGGYQGCSDGPDADVVRRFVRAMIDRSGELRTGLDRAVLTEGDVERIAPLSTEQVECAVRASLAGRERTEGNARAIMERLRGGVAHVLEERTGTAARERLETTERLLARSGDDRRMAAFLWQLAESGPARAAASLEALGIEPASAEAAAQRMSQSGVRAALHRGVLPEMLGQTAAAVREAAPDAVELLRNTRETFGESDPLRFRRLAWHEARALGPEGSFVREAAGQAIHDHEAERRSSATWRAAGTAAVSALAGPVTAIGAIPTNGLLAHAEVMTQRAGVIAGISSGEALEHARHERKTTIVAGCITAGLGGLGGVAAEHFAGPVAEGVVEGVVDFGSHVGLHRLRER